jgi:RimJ/RimL family protein N-acetyltransferase
MLAIRVLNQSDVAEIESWPPYQGDMAQMDYALRSEGWLKECLSLPDVYLYAAEDGDDLVGFTILNRTGPEEAEFRIALRADKTGMGLGEGITIETLRIGFLDLGFSRIYLIVRKNNIRGINLYRRLGFVSRGECRKQIAGTIIDFWMMDIDAKQVKKEA